MSVILHLGAHQCATSGFQAYLDAGRGALRASGIAVWGPQRARGGLLRGVMPGGQRNHAGPPADARAAQVRLAQARAGIRAQGMSRLLLSDPALGGSIRENIRLAAPYCGIAERAARLSAAFDGGIDAVLLIVRHLDDYWTSALTHAVGAGLRPPAPGTLARIAGGQRGWLAVAADLATALPGARVTVAEAASIAAAPAAALAALTGLPAHTLPPGPLRRVDETTAKLPALRALAGARANELPQGGGLWSPFSTVQRAMLRHRSETELAQIAAGTVPGVHLLGDAIRQPIPSDPAGPTPPMTTTRGTRNDGQDKNLARPG